MKVSLLIPVYGVERYIARCAESLFGQTYDDLEFIFVDDCTPDGSIAVLEDVLQRFPQRRGQVRIIRHEKNKGLGAARATALEAATGDCVMHVDSDYYIPENAVEALCRKMNETGAEVVHGAYARPFDGKAVSTHLPYHGTTEAYVCLLLCQNVFSNRVWGRLYRRSVYDKGVRHVPGIDYGEDYGVVPLLLYKCKRAWTDDVVYCYRTDNITSYTHVLSEKNNMSYLRANAEVYRFIKEKDSGEGHYAEALEYGMLNMLRHARKNNIAAGVVNDVCGYRPTGFLPTMCAMLLRSRCPYWLADAVYRACRNMFVRRASAF